MTPKWLSTFGTSFDLSNQGNIGENFRLTRVGESFLFTVGLNVDVSRGNVGFNIALIPRFLGRSNRSPAARSTCRRRAVRPECVLGS